MTYAHPANAAPAGSVPTHAARGVQSIRAPKGTALAWSTAEYAGDDDVASMKPKCQGFKKDGTACPAYATQTGYCPGHEGARQRFMQNGPEPE